MKGKDLLSIADIDREELQELLESALEMKGTEAPQTLRGKFFALMFEKPSLRTRVSFEIAIRQLGGEAIYLGRDEIGLGQRESVGDVARVLSRYVQGIVARTFSQEVLGNLAENASVPVINALSDWEHPCQALADLLTILEIKGRLERLRLAFIGDGNNVARSLLLAASLAGMKFSMAVPRGYELDGETVGRARALAGDTDTWLTISNSPSAAVRDADVVYTDVWTSMGQEAEREKRKRDFASYQVTTELMSLAKDDAIFMHPLPAHHGEEVTAEVLSSPYAVVFQQAENRLHFQRALLAKMFRTRGNTLSRPLGHGGYGTT